VTGPAQLSTSPSFADAPHELQEILTSAVEVEFATLTRSGAPVANPLFPYYDTGARSIDIGTGVAYPAKADRARMNPHVGLLFAPGSHAGDPASLREGGDRPDLDVRQSPVALLWAVGSVRDSDIQANTDRYVREFLSRYPKSAPPWTESQSMVQYWARIWIECTPVRALWWPRGLESDEEPRRWEATENSIRPSDPEPSGTGSIDIRRPAVVDWRPRAAALASSYPTPVLTTVDRAGFPLPFPTFGATLADDGFELDVPHQIPSECVGRACLTFGGAATFVGELARDSRGTVTFTVHRLLGSLPKVLAAPEEARANGVMARLVSELDRRGQPIPIVRQT
jgi:hypothetical protein